MSTQLSELTPFQARMAAQRASVRPVSRVWFGLSDKHYVQFPDANGFRLPVESLADPDIRDRLRLFRSFVLE